MFILVVTSLHVIFFITITIKRHDQNLCLPSNKCPTHHHTSHTYNFMMQDWQPWYLPHWKNQPISNACTFPPFLPWQEGEFYYGNFWAFSSPAIYAIWTALLCVHKSLTKTTIQKRLPVLAVWRQTWDHREGDSTHSN